VETAVKGILVFPLTIRAHSEMAHGGPGTVIRDIFDNGKTGATVSAVGEGIAVAPVIRGENLVPTLLASGNVGRDQLILPFLSKAILYYKLGVSFRGMNGDRDLFDAGHQGGFGLKIDQEAFYRLTLDLDIHFAGGIPHPAG
jgi:hypothetical protein